MGQERIYRSDAGAAAIKTKYDEWLRHWPVEKDRLNVKTRFGETHVIACGNPANPPLVLLHGDGGNNITWLSTIQELARAHRVYAVDIIGEANHSAPHRPAHKAANYRVWMEEVLAALQVREAAFVGISLGAWICLALASSAPERITRLVLISPAGLVPVRKSYQLKWILSTLFLGGWGRRRMFRKRLGQHHMDPRLTEYSELIAKHFRSRGPGLPVFSTKTLGHLFCPVLVLIGGKDHVYDPEKLLLRLGTQLPYLQVEFRRGEGHAISDFSRSVERFLLTQYPPD